jgi:hypothetical protein
MTAIPVARRIPRVRWGIGVLLGVGILVNYTDLRKFLDTSVSYLRPR